MTRTTAREIAVHLSYELGFSAQSAEELLNARLTKDAFHSLAETEPLYQEFPSKQQEAYIRTLVTGVGEHGFELDAYIEKYAIGWKFSRIPRVAAAIMRIAMYEMLYMPDIPNAAAINEAVELTKHYEDDKVVSFVNGILGSFLRQECGAVADCPAPAADKGSGDGE